MPEEDMYLKMQREMMLSAEGQNREGLLSFYKSLGQLSVKKIPARIRGEDRESKVLSDSVAILKGKIDSFAKEAPSLTERQADISVGRLAIAMFLIDRTQKLRKVALERDSVSLYSLYLSMRNLVCGTLNESFYSEPPEEVISDFLDAEPIVSACSELCGLIVPPLGEIVSEFKKQLADEVAKRG